MSADKSKYAHVEKLIRRLAPVWQDRLGLNHFEIGHAFLDSFYPDEGACDDFHTTANAEVRWNYQQAKIKWWLCSAIRHDDETLEKTLIHELWHVVLACEQSLLEDELEIVCRRSDPDEYAVVAKLYWERMEMATENATRASIRTLGLVGDA